MSVSFYARTFLGAFVELSAFVESEDSELICKKCPEAPKPTQRYCGFCGEKLISFEINVPTEKFTTWAKKHNYENPLEAYENLINDEFDETGLRILKVEDGNYAFGHSLGVVSSYKGGNTTRSLVRVNLVASNLQKFLDELGITAPIEIFTILEF